MKPLIAIPTFNESKNIARVIDEVRAYASDILIIDDGSTDSTLDILGHLPVRILSHKFNRGYGQSLIDAFNYADSEGFDWVITLDADGQHEADSIPNFFEEMDIGRWDLISGSRYLAARNDDDLPPPERRNVNFRITRILNDLFGMELTDSFCGFKAHRTSSMMKLNLTEAGYAFPLQLWPRVWEHRLAMKEVPVRRIYNDPNRSFGENLDKPDDRFAHYIDVLNRELLRMNMKPVHVPQKTHAHDCCCCH